MILDHFTYLRNIATLEATHKDIKKLKKSLSYIKIIHKKMHG